MIGSSNRYQQSRKFYKIIITRTNGFECLLEALKDTHQSGAANLLLTGTIKRNRAALTEMHANCSITYDKNIELGRGSNGTIVFKGVFANRNVAVKQIHSAIVSEKNIEEEIENLMCCDPHENVIQYFYSEHAQPYFLIALELCDMSLKDWIKSKKPIEMSPVEILRQTTVGLEWLHKQRIVHRDLKPANILLIAKITKVKISDFGLSRRILEEKSCVSSVTTGTDGWVAPEILRSIQDSESLDGWKLTFTFASDIFSLGCLYYYVLTNGKHAFGDRIKRNANIVDGNSSIISNNISSVCVENIKFINLMISNDPSLRPSCTALLACPLFWLSGRRVKFLEDLEAQGKEVMEAILASYKASSHCHLGHKPELEVISRIRPTTGKCIGCVVPFAYLEYQMMEEISGEYYSGMRNSSENFMGYKFCSQDAIESMLRIILIAESFDRVHKVIKDIEKLKSIRIKNYTPFLQHLISHSNTPVSYCFKKCILLLHKNADPDAENENGSTVLRLAAKEVRDPSLFNGLLKCLIFRKKTHAFGISDSLNNTVLHYAVQNFEPLEQSLAILAYYCNGIRIFNTINNEGNSVLHNAIIAGRSVSFLRRLLKRGAEWNCSNRYKRSVLHIAAFHLHLPAIKLFISLGDDVNAQIGYGLAVLHEALKRYNEHPQQVEEIVEVLVKNGANLKVTNIYGELPLEYLRRRNPGLIVGQRIIELLEGTVGVG
ncbi:unnamed protein product [Orchesella dallaii]|uniref:Protein kinase domain-containing protein n=1 Tax=Orchesella dallaii TaxID=48710 RepID=A0ABP1PW53_9HEXA